MAARRFGELLLLASLLLGIISFHSRLSIRNFSTTFTEEEPQRRLSAQEKDGDKPLRILYIVTSLAEYNNGRRFTTRGDDRLKNFMLPVLVEGVESMIAVGYSHVDVFLITHWKMRRDRLKLIREALPKSVGLQVWDEATPIGYKLENQHNHTDPVTRGLARQHRYVIKDKLLEYDLFVNFEDDMLVKGEHVQQYIKMSQQLASLRDVAPIARFVPKRLTPMRDIFYGPLNKAQFGRLVPGLMRVEVLRDEDKHGAQTELDPIPVDLDYDGVTRSVDPSPCCHVSNSTASTATHIPQSPSSDKIFIWETGIKGLSVREIPGMGWVGLQSGAFLPNRNRCIGNYWSGRDGHFGNMSRPIPGEAMYLNNQGGWMATRQQILEWHTEQCPCGFLPPYDEPCYEFDGLDLRNVEYWSGGMSLFQSFKACNLQRIVSLDPDEFSRQLVYHSANNKQKQLKQRGKQDRFVKVDNLLGQLNTVRKNAEAAKKKELEQ